MFRSNDDLRSRPRRTLPGEDGGRDGARYIEVGGGTGGGRRASSSLARITGRAGTDPPWRYSGVQVEHDGSDAFEPGNFSEVSGGDVLGWDLVNLNEVGPDGAGVNPVSDDSIVVYQQDGSRYFFVHSNYKGTYP